MTVLVTGAAGRIGRTCVEQGGAGVIGLARPDLDLCDAASVRAAFAHLRPRAVINAAALVDVERAEREPSAADAVNRAAAATLAAACEVHGIPLFHISSDYVFDGRKGVPYVESDATTPINVYGHSKLGGEDAVRADCTRHLILRASWVFGRHGRSFVSSILEQARRQAPLRVVNDQFGGPTAAGALAEALLQLVRRAAAGEELAWGTYHYCGGPHVSWHAFAETIVERALALGLLPESVPVQAIATHEFSSAVPRPADTRLDCSKIGQVFGITQPDWRVGLDDVLRHLKSVPA